LDLTHIHPDDVDRFAADLREIASEKEVVATRFRVIAAGGEYHWVEGHGKPYIDAQGNIDGIIGSMRVADDKVEAERKLERLARFDTLDRAGEPGRGVGPPRIRTHLLPNSWNRTGSAVLRYRSFQGRQ